MNKMMSDFCNFASESNGPRFGRKISGILIALVVVLHPFAYGQDAQKAFEQYRQERDAIDQQREGGVPTYKAEREAQQSVREEARRQFVKNRQAQEFPERAAREHIRQHYERESERKKLRQQYLAERQQVDDEVRLSFHDMNELFVTSRPRVEQSKRDLFRDGSGLTRGGSTASRASSRPTAPRRESFRDRVQPRDQREFGDRGNRESVSDRARSREDFRRRERSDSGRGMEPPGGGPPATLEPSQDLRDEEEMPPPPPPFIEDEEDVYVMPEEAYDDEDVYYPEDDYYD